MRRQKEFLGLLCSLYMIGMTVLLPLYTGGTFSDLGDTKYVMFRNLTLLCLGVWLVISAAEGLGELVRMLRHAGSGWRNEEERFDEEHSGRPRCLSVTDVFMLLYGGAVLISALCSQYERTPWTGYHEWYMGAVSQLLFVGIYFFISRCYDGKRYPVFLGIGGFSLVIFFGILHRLGVDPLGLLKDFGTMAWTYSHMLSTVGNINWFCGYVSVTLALPTALYLKCESRWRRAALYLVSVAGLFLLFIQGSDIGVILTAVCLLVCLVWGLGDGTVFRRTFLLLAGMAFLLPCYSRLAALLGESALMALPEDSIGWRVIGSNLWWIVGAGALGLWALLWRSDAGARGAWNLRRPDAGMRGAWNPRRPDAGAQRTWSPWRSDAGTRENWECCVRSSENREGGGRLNVRVTRLQVAGVVLLLLALAGGAAFFLAGQPTGEMWGNGRGALWRTALQGFRRNGPLQKLIGVGPDCFAEYTYSVFSRDAFPELEGRWAGTVYANAHNEWLNHLINLGIIGTGCYLGIFLSGAVRYRRRLPGILALAMYGTASLTGFQQCMSTPLLFLMLGLCESAEGGVSPSGGRKEGGERKDALPSGGREEGGERKDALPSGGREEGGERKDALPSGGREEGGERKDALPSGGREEDRKREDNDYEVDEISD
ncbi:MAG: O-antigen ligase family protein [Roseburia sp.]|nr:O-antigen ligase family protein [Roseburia sp.]MCM1097894.1 O-antigen ligase family protein [Ruminococcus flavefaciens]